MTDYKIKVVDPAGKTIQLREDVRTNEFGAFHESVKIPDNGLWGGTDSSSSCRIATLEQHFKHWSRISRQLPSGVENRLNGSKFQLGDQLVTTTNATLFSGGPYRNAPTQVSVKLERATFKPSDPRLDEFSFRTFHEGQRSNQVLVARVGSELSAAGEHELTTQLDVRDYPYGTLTVESVVRDDRGRSVATETRARFFGVDRFVGMKRESWSYPESVEPKVDVVWSTAKVKPLTTHEWKSNCNNKSA